MKNGPVVYLVKGCGIRDPSKDPLIYAAGDPGARLPVTRGSNPRGPISIFKYVYMGAGLFVNDPFEEKGWFLHLQLR